MENNENRFIVTLEETLYQQKDLCSLCKDRELKTNEIFSENSFYGIDHIIKVYSGIKFTHQLKFIIPHGITLNQESIAEYEIKNKIPIILCYPDYRKLVLKKYSRKLVISFSSPFVYVHHLLSKTIDNSKRKGLIFFPAHSTHHINALMDFEILAEKLDQLDDKFKPITICLYWKDFLDQDINPFYKRGFRIVSAGHIYDKNFFSRLYYLLSQHKYSSSNIIGSSLFYSVKAGCSFFFIDYGNYEYKGEKEVLQRDHPKESLEITENLYKMFSKKLDSPSEKQLQIIDQYLNTKYFLSPIQLKFFIYFCDVVYYAIHIPKLAAKKIINLIKQSC